MSGENTSGWINSIIKPVVDITVSVGAVMAYLQAIFKLVDTAYPNTFSVLTIIFTWLMVVGWRWGKLTQKKKKSSNNESASAAKGKSPFLANLLKPVRAARSDPYTMPLTRRRAEAGFLAALTVFTLGWSGVNAQSVAVELTKDPALTCSDTPGKDHLLVLVADLAETGSAPALLIPDQIYESLVLDQAEWQYDVCRLAETIKLSTIAAEKAKEHKADIVIWGRVGVLYEIHLEAPALANPHRMLSELSSAEAASVEFQFKEPEHIAYATQFALSELLFMKGQVAEAQFNQNKLLRAAEQDGLREQNPQALANGYFLLGLFYDPGYSANPNEEQALLNYQKAADLNPRLYAASFNRGLILMAASRMDEAIAEFTRVIESEDETLKASALVNRAGLLSDPKARLHDLDRAIEIDPAEGYFFRGIERMNQEDYRGAIQDFDKAVEADPQGYYNYHLLGQAQLYAGELEAAKETYVRIVPTLDEESRQQVISELRAVASQSTEIAPTVEEIIASLQKAKLR